MNCARPFRTLTEPTGGAPPISTSEQIPPLLDDEPTAVTAQEKSAPVSASNSSSAPVPSTVNVQLLVQTGAAITSTALAWRSWLFVGSQDGSFSAFDPKRNLAWRLHLPDRIRTVGAVSPGGTVFFGGDNDTIYAVDALSGKILWHYVLTGCRQSRRPGPVESRCDIEGIVRDQLGNLIVSADGIYSFTEGGVFRWRQGDPQFHCAAPAFDPVRRVAYAACQNKLLYAIDSNSGQKRWEAILAAEHTTAMTVFADGKICAGSEDARVTCWSPLGSIMWSTATRGPMRAAGLAHPNGAFILGSDEGVLYAFSGTGQILWTFAAQATIRSTPTIGPTGNIIFGSQDDRLYAVTPNGQLAWSTLLGGDVDGSPVLVDGNIVVGSDDGGSYLVSDSSSPFPDRLIP